MVMLNVCMIVGKNRALTSSQIQNRLTQKFRCNTSFWFTGGVSDPENPNMSIPNCMCL